MTFANSTGGPQRNVPEGQPRIAQRFSVGNAAVEESSPEGTTESRRRRVEFSRPFGTWPLSVTQPNAEALGYSRDVRPGQGLAPCSPLAEGGEDTAGRHAAKFLDCRGDPFFVGLALAQGMLLVTKPSLALIALGMWWNANTISHNFIHRPFFRGRHWNAIFSAYLSLVLGVPQSLWRARHLAHHAGVSPAKFRIGGQMIVEGLLILAVWIALLVFAPQFLLTTYLPGLGLGLGLCQLQGHYEHVRGTVSHYGRLYNVLFFNDGYHVEHHLRPAMSWARLPAQKAGGARVSRWPAVLRWLDVFSLTSLERLVLRSKKLQTFVLKKHEKAFRALLTPRLTELRSIQIVGGGLFPRTALVLKRLAPQARLRIVDARAENLQQARRFLGEEMELTQQFFDPSVAGSVSADCDLLVIPLDFEGDREAIYRRPPARTVAVHDWLWRRRGVSSVVSVLLLKRLNLASSIPE